MPHSVLKNAIRDICTRCTVPYQKAWVLIQAAIRSGHLSSHDVIAGKVDVGTQYVDFGRGPEPSLGIATRPDGALFGSKMGRDPHQVALRSAVRDISKRFNIAYESAWVLIEAAIKSGLVSSRDIATGKVSTKTYLDIGLRFHKNFNVRNDAEQERYEARMRRGPRRAKDLTSQDAPPGHTPTTPLLLIHDAHTAVELQ